jgi:hypothetical protein
MFRDDVKKHIDSLSEAFAIEDDSMFLLHVMFADLIFSKKIKDQTAKKVQELQSKSIEDLNDTNAKIVTPVGA